jgi:hypothetical protein
LQNFKGSVAFLSQGNTTPLRKSVAFDLNSIAICGKKWFNIASSSNIGVENFINYSLHVFKNVSAVDKALVKGY